jgi:hypothetical protein
MPRKRTIEIVLSQSADFCMQNLVREELSWYNSTPYAHLTVFFIVDEDTGEIRQRIRQLIDAFRQGKDSQKSDPNFKVLMSGEVTDGFIDFIEELDCRLPRITLMPHFPDRPGFAGLADRMVTTVARLKRHIVDWRLSITVESPHESLGVLQDELDRLERDAGTSGVLRPFPLLEIPFGAASTDAVRLEEHVAELWSRWPQLNDAVNGSRGGYVKHFYSLKELWHLGQVMRQTDISGDLARLRTSYGLDGGELDRLERFDRAFLDRHASFDLSPRWRYKNDNVVLEFDLDSIADTYECQSPVFIDNKWILEGGSLPAGADKAASAEKRAS